MNKTNTTLILGLLSLFVYAGFQPIVVTSNETFQNLTVTVCSSNAVCDDIWNQTFTSTSTQSSRVVYLEGDFNTTYEDVYYYNAWVDGKLLFNQTRGYMGRETRMDEDLIISGNINLTGKSNVYFNLTKEIEIGVSRFRLPGLNPPRETVIGVFPTLQFDDAQEESVYSGEHVLDDYLDGTDWTVSIYWAPVDTNPGNVTWCVEIVGLTPNQGETLGDATGTYCVTDETRETQYELLQSGNITVSGAGTHVDDQFGFRLYRDADAAGAIDNYGSDAALVEATVYYNTYRLGG